MAYPNPTENSTVFVFKGHRNNDTGLTKLKYGIVVETLIIPII